MSDPTGHEKDSPRRQYEPNSTDLLSEENSRGERLAEDFHRGERHRGRLSVSARVVEKIATQCLQQITDVGGRSGGFLGLGKQADLDARPSVSVELSGAVAALRVELGIAYPRSITKVTQRVRQTLLQQVSDLSGVRVAQVDIKVTYLAARTHREERVLQ